MFSHIPSYPSGPEHVSISPKSSISAIIRSYHYGAARVVSETPKEPRRSTEFLQECSSRRLRSKNGTPSSCRRISSSNVCLSATTTSSVVFLRLELVAVPTDTRCHSPRRYVRTVVRTGLCVTDHGRKRRERNAKPAPPQPPFFLALLPPTAFHAPGPEPREERQTDSSWNPRPLPSEVRYRQLLR